MSDPFDLDRFVRAQDGTYDAARAEIASGRKTGHWMWFVFPQIAGLGQSEMARRYGISGLAEARAYMDHALLGPRLTEISELLLTHRGTPAQEILGATDALKLRSCATLFAEVRAEPFGTILSAFHDGTRCPLTQERL